MPAPRRTISRLNVTSGGTSGTGTGGTGGGTPPGPVADITGLTVSGFMDPVTAAITLTVSVTPPGTGTFVGCHLYLEIPDQSSTPAVTVGTTPVGSAAAITGAWSVLDLGQFPYVAAQQPWTITLAGPATIDPTIDIPCRLYAAAYSTDVDNALVQANQAGPTPNAAFNLVSLASGTPTSGTGVTGLTGADGNHIGITATVLPPVNVTGKLETPIMVTVSDTPDTKGWVAQIILTVGTVNPSDPANQQVIAGYITEAGPVYAPAADGISIPHSFALDTPKALTKATVWLQAGLVDDSGKYRWNDIVPGITPSWPITYGSTVGTHDAAAVMLASIDASMAVVGTLFGVAASGITNPLMGSGAVATINVQNLAVTNALLASLAVAAGNMAPSSVTSGNSAIAALAVVAGDLANASVTSATIAAAAVSTTAIASAAITTALIATAAVGSAAIANAAIGTAAIQTACVTNALIANLAVSLTKIQDATITGAKIGSATIANANMGAASIDSGNIANLAVGTANIQDAAITGVKIGTATITSANIANGTITNAQIANATITGAQITNATITDAHISTCNVGKLTAGTANFASDVTFRNGTTGPYVLINSTGLTIHYNASNEIVVSSGQVSITTNGLSTNFGGGGSNDAGMGAITCVSLSVGPGVINFSQVAGSAGGLAGYLLISVLGNGYKLPYYYT